MRHQLSRDIAYQRSDELNCPLSLSGVLRELFSLPKENIVGMYTTDRHTIIVL
jgi:hypothetical protein